MSESYDTLREQADAIMARQAEAAERARWIAVTPETMPKPGNYVLAHFLNAHSKPRVVRAMYATEKVLHASEDAPEDCFDEESGEYWAPPGWYEVNDNDETIWLITETVTHWCPLPAPPVLP